MEAANRSKTYDPSSPFFNGEWYHINEEDIGFIKRGDYIEIMFSPFSQKHFFKDDYDHYFPIYFGKVMSNCHSRMEDLLIKDPKGKDFYYENRCGTSGMMSCKFYRPKKSDDIPQSINHHPYFDLTYNAAFFPIKLLDSTFIIYGPFAKPTIS